MLLTLIKKYFRKLCVVVSACAFLSCAEMLAIDPPINEEIASEVFKSNSTAAAVLTGIFYEISDTGTPFSGRGGLSFGLGLYADELNLRDNVAIGSFLLPLLYSNSLTPRNAPYWNNFYQIIYRCNAALEGLNDSNSLSPLVKSRLQGEAKFVRAFCYFYITNLFGEAPILLGTDYKINLSIKKSPVLTIYEQIISDLNEAKNLLTDEYLHNDLTSVSGERIRPNKGAACALLSRVYLYLDAYEDAEIEADKVIGQNGIYSLTDINSVFLSNSSEAIWQLQPVSIGENTKDGLAFVLPAAGPNSTTKPAYMSQFLLPVFGGMDNRSNYWMGSVNVNGITYKYPYKYKVGTLGQPLTEYLMILRLAEQYLIRSEARTKRNNIVGGLEDLNVIRRRSGLPDTTLVNQQDLLSAITLERQRELFTEWGHRWFDICRLDLSESVMSQVSSSKGAEWMTYKRLFPIPENNIILNPNLAPNNVGY